MTNNFMGSCVQTGKINKPNQIHKQIIQTSNNEKSSAANWNHQECKQIIQNFPIINKIKFLLKDISYTSNDLKQISKSIADLLTNLKYFQQSKIEHKDNCSSTKKILNQNQIKYDQLLKKVQQNIQQTDKYQKLATKQRVILGLANRFSCEQTKIETVHLRKYYKHVNYAYYSNYPTLNQQELDYLINLRIMEKEVSQFTQQLQFKYQSMKEGSTKMTSMLIDIFEKYKQELQSLKYDISEAQTIRVADISRDACNYHDQGIYFLLTYVVKCCKKLQKDSIKTSEIENRLCQVLDKIKDKYPPGIRIDGQENDFKALRKLEVKQQAFKRIYPLTYNKSENLDRIILENAVLAKKNLIGFEHLIRNTCLQNCISYKAGLKLNPDLINQVSQKKAIIRIKQKMLLKNKQDLKPPSHDSTISQLLVQEQENYAKIIIQQLNKLNQIQFKISDMLRGKCIFISISDIIQTVTLIKEYVNNDPFLKIIEIEDRFSGKVPISDVTLKIEFGTQVVAQLQLTLQTNKAAYDFAHKIYQFNRCKVFSKIKIIHNYFEQYSKDFKQITGRALNLSSDQTSQGLYVLKKIIQYFFDIDESCEMTSFQNLLQSQLMQKSGSFCQLQLLRDCSEFFKMVFSRKMKQSIKQLSRQAMKIIRTSKQLPNILLGMIFYQIFEDIELTDFSIYEQWYSYLQYLSEEVQIKFDDKWCQKTKLSPHAIIKLLQLIHLFKVCRNGKINQFEVVMKNLYGQSSIEYCEYLIKYGKIKDYCKQYEESNKSFQHAKQILIKLAIGKKSNSEKVCIQNKILNVQLFIAQSCLKLRKTDEAHQIIQTIMNKYRQGQPCVQFMLCQLLNAQCTLYNDIQEFYKQYERVIQKSNSFGISLRGRNIAESQYRIGQYLLQKQKQQRALDIHFRNAFEQFGAYMTGRQIYNKMCQIWLYYLSNSIAQPHLKPNGKLKQLYLQNSQIDAQKCYYLSKVNWPNLIQLNLWQNYIGPNGCKYICQADWPHLRNLNLYCNQIGDEGCIHLKNTNWPQLTKIVLAKNNITDKGCKQLSESKWYGLNCLSLYQNQIADKGCQYLKQAPWLNINQLNLSQNFISSNGFRQLTQAKWQALVQLKIWSNPIKNDGCKYLEYVNWPVIQKIYLWDTQIDKQGCQYILKANFPHLKLLNLTQNGLNIEDANKLQKYFINANIPI